MGLEWVADVEVVTKIEWVKSPWEAFSDGFSLNVCVAEVVFNRLTFHSIWQLSVPFYMFNSLRINCSETVRINHNKLVRTHNPIRRERMHPTRKEMKIVFIYIDEMISLICALCQLIKTNEQ